MSIDGKGLARLEKLSFDAYNECDVPIRAIERFRSRTGRCPERVLVDQIYRNRKNRAYCKANGIRMSGPALGRPKRMTTDEKKRSYIDNTDRIEVERGFRLAKRCYGLGLLRAKLDVTTRSSIAVSIIAMNVNRLTCIILRCVMISIFSKYIWRKNQYENIMLEPFFHRGLMGRHYISSQPFRFSLWTVVKEVVNPFASMRQSAFPFQPLRKRKLRVRNSSAS